ncbi:hypothetical protein CERSUDRAFT_111006 [Gelatoporia subvermispora B]|uniref:Autophagy-related protein 29 n=1 Tax=Ceriporiopsis subvermispora (strain B) TaxID=914234 RepID=M2RNH5_CERS8|nr:hypothetical protein CERSUDRAFT_111006 [Gelatoporia subvermispora B]
MAPLPQAIRVVIRLPYNRPDDPLPNPPRVEWNVEKEQILWEVIAKARAIEGAGTDWKGLASHLEVPLPYLLYRAQTRYEEDLRGLQGIRSSLSATPIAPSVTFPSLLSQPSQPSGEHFPSVLPRIMSRRDSVRLGGSSSLGVRARLSSLGRANSATPGQTPQPLFAVRTRTPSTPQHGHGHRTKKVSSSSTLTLQGPKRPRSPLCPLSPASSRAGSSSSGEDAASEDEDDVDEEARREEEAETQEALARRLSELARAMTKDKLGLVSSAAARDREKGKAREGQRRGRLLSYSSADASVSASASASVSASQSESIDSRTRPRTSYSRQSLSSASAGSIPSLPSPPPRANSYDTQPRSPPAGMLARHLGSPGKSKSPPVISPGNVMGQAVGRHNHAYLADGRRSEQGSEASSFSDLSDASLSASALESALMSNIRGNGSRLSSFARSNFAGRRALR